MPTPELGSQGTAGMTAATAEYVEDLVGLYILSDMTPAEKAAIQIRRVLAYMNTVSDITTRLVG